MRILWGWSNLAQFSRWGFVCDVISFILVFSSLFGCLKLGKRKSGFLLLCYFCFLDKFELMKYPTGHFDEVVTIHCSSIKLLISCLFSTSDCVVTSGYSRWFLTTYCYAAWLLIPLLAPNRLLIPVTHSWEVTHPLFQMSRPVESAAWRSLLSTKISAIPLVSGPRKVSSQVKVII